MRNACRTTIIILSVLFMLSSCDNSTGDSLAQNTDKKHDLIIEMPYKGDIPENTEIIANNDLYTISRYSVPLKGDYDEIVFDVGKGLSGKHIIYGRLIGKGMVDGKFKSLYRYGIMNTVFKIVTAEEYDAILNIDFDRAIILQDDKYGVISTEGDTILPTTYKYKPVLTEEYIKVKTIESESLEEYGYYDRVTGLYMYSVRKIFKGGRKEFDLIKIGLDGSQTKLDEMVGNEADIRIRQQDLETGLWGFTDGFGNLVVKQQFEEVQDFQENKAVVKLDGKYGYINPIGEICIDCIYDMAHSFSEGYGSVINNGKYGFVDEWGQLKIDFQYIYSNGFHEGLASVYMGEEKWGFVNDKNEFIFEEYYLYAGNFSNGLVSVKKPDPNNQRYIYINKMGAIAFWDLTFEYAYRFNVDGCAMATDRIYNIGTGIASHDYLDYVFIIELHSDY